MRALCLLVPVAAGAQRALAAQLAVLESNERSPLAALPGVHLARFVLMPSLEGRDGRPIEPPRAHLLFCADADGPPEAVLDAIVQRLPVLCESVWRHCDGWPAGGDAEALRGFLARHRVDPGFTVAPYAPATVTEIREALHLRRRVAEFAAANADLPAGELARAWREAFAT